MPWKARLMEKKILNNAYREPTEELGVHYFTMPANYAELAFIIDPAINDRTFANLHPYLQSHLEVWPIQNG